jgi:hypothetical protein
VQPWQRIDLRGGDREHSLPIGRQRAHLIQQREESHRTRPHRLQVEMHTVEAEVEHLGGRGGDPVPYSRLLQIQTRILLREHHVAEPGLDPQLGHRPVYLVDEPPGPGMHGRGQAAVVLP